MKQSSNFAREKMEMWGTSSLFRLAFFSALIVVGVLLSMSCNHGSSGKKTKTPEIPNTPNLADLQISQFTIKDKDAKSGRVVFKGKSITIDKEEIKLTFKEADAPKDFKCSQELPVTVQAGKEMTLTFSTVATSKYKEWKQDVTIKCTTLEFLDVPTVTVHERPMDHDGRVILENTYKKVETNNVKVTFKESDAPSYTLSGLPLTLEAGKDFTFKILTNATTKYEASAFTVTVSVKKDNVKTIEDCVRQLGFQLGWKDQVVSNDINLPTSVNEFEGATVVWKSKSAYLTDAGKIIKRDIVNVTAEMEATVSWNGNTKKTTFNVAVERLKKIREIKKVNAVDWTYTVDFSQDNVLKYLEKIGNNSEMTVLEFDIKEVNFKDQILVAELKRKSVGQDLLTCEEFISSKVKQFLEAIDREFSSQYFALKKNDNPQWEDIHNYLVSAGFVKKDASLIDSFTTFKQLSRYQGTQEDFVKCTPSEKKTYIIAMLDEIKSIHCERDDVPTDTSDDKLVETLKKAVLTKDGIPAKHHFKVWKYKYTLNKTDETEKFPDGYSFDAQSIFDESKEWYNQLGVYSYVGEGKKSALNVLEADGTMKVEGNIEGQVNYEFAGYATAGNTFKVSVKATNQELAFTVGLASPGHISVKTAGAVESDVQMDFHAYHIFDVLKTLP